MISNAFPERNVGESVCIQREPGATGWGARGHRKQGGRVSERAGGQNDLRKDVGNLSHILLVRLTLADDPYVYIAIYRTSPVRKIGNDSRKYFARPAHLPDDLAYLSIYLSGA